MIVVTFRTDDGGYFTVTYDSAEDLHHAIYYDHSAEAITGLWEVK